MESLSDILKNKKTVKPPAYPWQELALRIIKELNIPGFKRGAIFKICKEKPEHFIIHALNDTKELCKTGMPWKYFFKLVDKKETEK